MNIWFNRWFSTVSHYMELLRNNSEGKEVKIFGTYVNNDTVYFKYCDVTGIEPDVKGEEYLEFCLKYCIDNEIDVFVPRKENVMISKNLDKFDAIGVKVLVCHDSELMEMMDNKLMTYEDIENRALEGNFLVDIPEYRIVNDVVGFEKAYKEIKEKGYEVCIKPVIGEGAVGFRIVDDRQGDIHTILNSASSLRMPYDQLVDSMRRADSFKDLIVLEYLDGSEYSVDCLADGEGNLKAVVPRKKAGGRIRELEDNPVLIEMANRFAETYKIPYVFNIQVRYSKKDGVPKLLEINPRMSGGMHISCLSGVNIPYNALTLLTENRSDGVEPKYGVRATHIETSVIM